ncbi:MAG TPA: hypothetical protein VHK91_03120 [Flavisolibacter sp.]|jgi:hypothetical protein|nr:hypothetical protein [Flavisolibacter sp.]
MKFLLLLFLLHIALNGHPQIDPVKLDSLSRTIDSQTQAIREQQQQFKKEQQVRFTKKAPAQAGASTSKKRKAYGIPALLLFLATFFLLLVYRRYRHHRKAT